MSAKTYLLRKGILEALKFYGSDMPCNVSDVSCHHRVQLLRVSEVEIVEQLRELEGMGFVKACEGFGHNFFKVTQKGLEAISPEFDTPPFISGRPS